MSGRSLNQILEELEGLVGGTHREVVRDLRSTEDPFDFGDKAQSMAIWGGQGSLVDLTLDDPADDRRLNELIVELEDALADLNLSTPRMQQVARLIEDWLIAHPA